MKKDVVSVLGEFTTPQTLLKAVKTARKAGYKAMETYTPFPVHGMDDAIGIKPSKLPWIVLICGAVGLASGFALQTWVSTSAYKLTISGKPFFSYQAFVPVMFELMVLFAAFGTVFGMLILNRLPRWYDALFKTKRFHTVTSHGFFLEIQAQDHLFDIEKTAEYLSEIGGTNVEVVKA